jgi:hypothetical protein
MIKKFRENSSEVMQKQKDFVNPATNRESSVSGSFQDNEVLTLQQQK